MQKISEFSTSTIKSSLLANKLMLSGATVIITAIVGTAGVAAAHSMDGSSFTPDNVTTCKSHYKDYDFKNVGQCVSWWNHHHDGHGYGYGGEEHHKHHHYHFHNYFADWWRHFFKH